LVNEGKFRHDLWDRIERHQITIPPLDKRAEDIPLFVAANRNDHKVDPGFLLALLKHRWGRGNVRELLDVIALAISRTTTKKERLCVRHLDPAIGSAVRGMNEEGVHRELYQRMEDILMRVGYEHGGRRGNALHKRMAELLECQPKTISGMRRLVYPKR
jgi:transcriptional regulator with PAS, ATPase and Fis domain